MNSSTRRRFLQAAAAVAGAAPRLSAAPAAPAFELGCQTLPYRALPLERALEGIRKAGSTDKYKVRDAIESLKGVVGTAGVFNFSAEDHNGLTMDSFEMLTVKNGAFAVYGR